MDAEQIRQLEPKLDRFLDRFADCFARRDTRAHLPTYVRGQLSDLPEKSVEPIALHAGVAPRTLQEFLTHHAWDHTRMRDRLQTIARDEPADGPRTGLLDENRCGRKGGKSA